MATTRYQALIQERADLVAEGRAIFQRAEGDGNRALSSEEAARDDAINARLEAIAGEVGREEARRERERLVGNDGGPRLSGGHDRSTDKPWGHELGVRIVEKDGVKSLGGVKHAVAFALGDCMQAIFRAGQGGPIDQRFLAAASGGNTSDPSLGGFSVGTMLSMALFQMGTDASVLLPLCNGIELSEGNDSIEMPYITDTSRATGSRYGGVRVYRRKEAATVTASQPEEEKFELSLLDLMGLAYQTDRLMRDARAMGQVYGTAFSNEFAFVIDNEIFRGSGVGESQGFTVSPALVTQDKETGQAADTVVMENLSKMWTRMPTRRKGNSMWLYNSEVGPQLDQLTIPAGTAGLEPRFVNYGPDGVLRIYGRPALELEQCAAVGDVGDIVLVNLDEYVVIRQGALEQAESDHVRFIYGERTFRWTQRINGKSPWRTAVTPFKGSATKSPFVALQAR
jgi:HK97 family phage major capsid protein